MDEDGGYFAGAAAAEQSVWGLGAHWYIAEICFLVPEIVFLCLEDECFLRSLSLRSLSSGW